MAPAPLRNPPARPRTASCAPQPRKTRRKDQKQKQKQKQEPVASLSSTHGVDLPVPGTASRSTPCVDGSIRYRNTSGVRARCEATGSDPVPFRQIAGNRRRRGGSGCGGVRGMDAAAKPTGTYLRRPPQPDPARQPPANRLLLWVLLRLWPSPRRRRVPGAARPKPTPWFRYNVRPVSQLRFPGHDGPRGRARPVAVPPRTS